MDRSMATPLIVPVIGGYMVVCCIWIFKDGKVWVQHNMTEMQIAQALMAMGVAKEDIVLGFQAEYMREYTGFGVA
jgi:XisI protein